MGITRGRLSIDYHFTPVPNEWARDARLSRRARGLLVEVMSHQIGWHITIRSLASSGKEGRDAIQTALNELVEFGYLRRGQSRDAGRFAEIEYMLVDPDTASGFSGHGEETPDQTASGFAVSGSTGSGESATKKTINSEDHPEEDQGLFAHELVEAQIGFADFWSAWPRKDSRKTAEAAWARAAKRTDPAVIVAAARAYAESPHRPEKQFVPYGATWLNGERWNDPLPEPPASARPSADDRLRSDLEFARRFGNPQAQEVSA